MHVHTLDNLDLCAPPGKRLVVLGDPIGHSLSPAMHNAALAQLAGEFPGLAGWRYEAVQVPAADLPRALPILHGQGVVGINLTIPHKVQALGLIEEVDPMAKQMGAVNTLVRTDSGYRGTNTDGFGIIKAVGESLGCSVSGMDVWLFGAGGAARGILVASLDAGAARVTVVNRSPERVQELEDDLRNQALPGLDRVRFYPQAGAPVDPEETALLINATSLGLKPSDPSPLPGEFLRPGIRVYDTTYGTVNTLARVCARAEVPYADGLSMLVWQGVRSLEIWTGKPVPAGEMRQAAWNELKNRQENG